MKKKIIDIWKIIVRCRAIIILLYEFFILMIFWLICRFNFHHNNSILMIILMLIVPIILSVSHIIIRKNNLSKFLSRKVNYHKLIQDDIKSNKFNKELIEPLKAKLSNVDVRISDRQILITGGSSDVLTVIIDDAYTKLSIDNTRVIYQFIYGYRGFDVTKYDVKGVSHFSTKYLYELIIKQVEKLAGKELTYTEYIKGKDYNGCSLKNEQEKIYSICLNEKKKIFKKDQEITRNIYI